MRVVGRNRDFFEAWQFEQKRRGEQRQRVQGVRAMAVRAPRRALPTVPFIWAVVVGLVLAVAITVQRHDNVGDDVRDARHLDGGDSDEQTHDHKEKLHEARSARSQPSALRDSIHRSRRNVTRSGLGMQGGNVHRLPGAAFGTNSDFATVMLRVCVLSMAWSTQRAYAAPSRSYAPQQSGPKRTSTLQRATLQRANQTHRR